ncbi:MAG: hypothetical protein IPJ20_19610 [Flammeovirgaceae bacterium]|nr:hypothetical protein [Flammeovirgaceae bacterium]
MRPTQLIEFLQYALPLKENVLLVGPPGVGKTDIVKQAVAKIGYDLIITHPVISEPTDYKGLPFPMGDEAVFLPYGQLKNLFLPRHQLLFYAMTWAPPPKQFKAHGCNCS